MSKKKYCVVCDNELEFLDHELSNIIPLYVCSNISCKNFSNITIPKDKMTEIRRYNHWKIPELLNDEMVWRLK